MNSWLVTHDPFGARDPFTPDHAEFADTARSDWRSGLRDLLADARLEKTTPPPPVNATSAPLYTTETGALLLTVIRAGWHGRDAYQLYAVEAGNWSLVGLFGLYVDALAEVCTWRTYIAVGGSLRSWMAAHPDGVRADVGSVVR